MMRNSQVPRKLSAGFGLVEVMVAVVIGMFGVIVMLQLFADHEARNRNVSGAADAQTNGAINFYQLQGHIRQAGYGMNGLDILGCQLKWKVSSNDISKPVILAPVSINRTAVIPPGDPNTDTLLIMYGNDSGPPEGNEIIDFSGSEYTVQMPTSFHVDDRVISAPSICLDDPLLIDRVTSTTPSSNKVTVESGGAGMVLYNLGGSGDGGGPTILAYAVRDGKLTVCNFILSDCSLPDKTNDATVWGPIASNIVRMRAVYWKDSSPNWDGSAHVSTKETPTERCDWARVKGVHLVLVARSDERDKDAVTSTSKPPKWSLDTKAPLEIVSTSDDESQHYRYKTFEALVPLRNVVWNMTRKPDGC